MKKITIISLLAFFLIGCNNAAQPTANTNVAVQNSANSIVVSSHSSDAQKTSSSESSPMSRAVDVNRVTADIEKAEKEYKKNPKAKDQLAKAYFERAFALTEAAQYRAALGDFRKGLKLNPNDDDAKAMHDKILEIFKSINREPPGEGEEPTPLPFKKGE